MPPGGLEISGDGRSAVLTIQSLAVIDQPKWPQLHAPTTPATMSFKVVWKATDERVQYEDPSRHYRFTGFRAMAQMEASVEVPAAEFAWKSDPLETSKANFAVIGEEVNGRYYDTA